jgi:hypothetical protein
MKSLTQRAVFAALLLALVSCKPGMPGAGTNTPGGPNVPDMPGGGGGGGLKPDSCGDYASKGGDVGRKLKAFLDAAATLDAKVASLEGTVKDSCITMGNELGLSGMDGDTKTVCKKVADEIRNGLQVGLKGQAKFEVIHKPAVCKVNASVAAKASAECEAKAQADVKVTCEGKCGGSCEGKCNGTCKAKNADGSCKGECDGTCEGSCSGECQGHASASGSAECQASAEVKANFEAECTPPELEVKYDVKMVVDKAKMEKTVSAIKKGLPGILAASARAKIAMKALTEFGKTAKDLAGSAAGIAKAFGDAAFCVAGQITAAASAVFSVQVHVEVSVEASAEVGGACGTST